MKIIFYNSDTPRLNTQCPQYYFCFKNIFMPFYRDYDDLKQADELQGEGGGGKEETISKPTALKNNGEILAVRFQLPKGSMR